MTLFTIHNWINEFIINNSHNEPFQNVHRKFTIIPSLYSWTFHQNEYKHIFHQKQITLHLKNECNTNKKIINDPIYEFQNMSGAMTSSALMWIYLLEGSVVCDKTKWIFYFSSVSLFLFPSQGYLTFFALKANKIL